MSKSRLFSGKIKKLSGGNLTVDRYEYLDPSQAEPDLGLPLVDNGVLTGSTSTVVRTWSTILTANTNSVNILSTLSTYGFESPNALMVAGGVSVGGFLNVAGKAYLNNAEVLTTQSGLTSILGISVINQTLVITTTTNSTSTNSGALVVVGGVGIGKDLFVGGSLTVNGALVLTTSSIGNAAVTSIVAGTDTAVSASTGAVTIWNTSTLQSITDRGNSTTNSISITNASNATSTNSGALKVSGGVGIGGDLYVGGEIVAQKLTIEYTTITTTIVETDDIIKTFNTTQSTNTQSGALQVSGGASIGKNLYIGGNLYVNPNNDGQLTSISISSSTAIQSNNSYLELISTAGIKLGITNSSTWTFNSSGISFPDATTQTTAFIGYANTATFATSSSYTEIALSLGTGTYTIVNATVATSTNSGALKVSGGVGIGGDLYVGGALYQGGQKVITTATINDYANQTTITAGTDTAVSTSTGNITIWNTSTLQSITDRGAVTTNNIRVNQLNIGPEYYSAGGYTSEFYINAYGIYNEAVSNNQLFQLATNVNTVTGGVLSGASVGGGGLWTAGGGIQLYSAADLTIRLGASLHQGGYPTGGTNATNRNIVISNTGSVTINSTDASSSTTQGALVVKGGVGIGGDLYVGGSLYQSGQQILTTASVNQYANQTAITAGTDTAVSTSTGNITIWNTSTLQSVTSRGNTTDRAIGITNTASSTVTNTDNALYVSGGAWFDKDVTVKGSITLTTATIVQVVGNSGQFFGDSSGFDALYAGIPTGFSILPSTVLQLTADINDYAQSNFQNINNGPKASTDWVLTSADGANFANFIDMAITSGTWDGTQDGSIGTAVGPNDGYLYVQGNTSTVGQGNLTIGVSSTGSVIRFFAGGVGSSAIVATINAPNTESTSTTTGALVLKGGAGIGGAVNIANTSYIAGSKILTSADLQTVTHTATYITNNPGSVTGLTTLAGTSTVYGTYNFGSVSDIWTFNDFNTATNFGFYSINDASTQPAHIVYIGFDGISDFNRIVLNINYTASSGHTQDIDLYNYVQNQWDTFTTYSGSTGWFEFILGTIDPSPYISGNKVTLRIYHVSFGNTSHRTWIDYVALEKSIQGGQGPRGPTGATGAQGIQGLTTTTTSTFVFANTSASTSTVTANSVYIAGGLGIAKSLMVTGEAVFQNNVTFAGTTTFVLTTNTVYTDNIIELHYPNTPGNVWAVNDGKDIGFRFHYYNGTDTNAGLVLANDSKYLEWYSSGVEDGVSTFTSGTYGTFKTGSIILKSTTASNSTSTGALTVSGGVGIGGDLYLGGALYQNGQQVLSTATINQYANQTSITAGTDTAVSTSTGAITIWNTSTLQTITGRGATTTNAISITNTTASVSTITGALTVAGGVGIGGDLWILGNLVDARSGIAYGVQTTGTTSTFVISNITQSISTNSGALQVAGGVGIGGNLFVGGTFTATAVFINGQSVGLGYTGSTGTQGNVGYTGSKGDVGYVGSASTATGYTGSKGQTGNDGTSVVIVGSTSTATILAFSSLDPSPTKGDGIIVTFNGHLWTYTSATGGASVFGFVDVGLIVGYTGSVGPAGAGYTGSQGGTGYTGFTGSASTASGYAGSTGYTGSKGGFEAVQIISTQTGTSYTLALTDAGYLINFTNAAGTTVTIPSDASVNFTVGQRVDLEQYNTGPVVVSPGVGVILHSTDSPILTNQYSIGTLIKIGPNEWTFAGPATSAAGYAGSQGTTGYAGSLGYTGSRGGFEATQVINTQTSSTYTLALTDAGELINFINSVGTTVTIPAESTTNFNIGQRIDLTQGNIGPVVVTAVSGVTLHSTDSPVLNNQYSIGTLIKIGSNEWTFAGPATMSVGYSGSVGYTGSTGTQGVTGFTGSTGTQGITGYTGSTGTQGNVGYTGSTGTQGVTGFTGSTGTQGNVGYTGSTGTQGQIGFTGSASTTSGTFSGGQIIGITTVTNTTSATSTTTGALTVIGGAGIGGNLYVGGNLATNNITTFPAGSNANLLIDPDGTGDVVFSTATQVTILDTSTSLSTTTGALLVTGGVGIGKNLYVGGTIYQAGVPVGGGGAAAGNITMYQSGYLTVTQGTQRWYAPYNLNVTSIKTKLGTAGSNANVITINKNSTATVTISIDGAATSGTTYTTPLYMNEDDYLTVDVTPVLPQATTATNLYVQFKYVAA